MGGHQRFRIWFSNDLPFPPGKGKIIFAECRHKVIQTLRKQYKFEHVAVCCDVMQGNFKFALMQRQGGSPALFACEKEVRKILEYNKIKVNEDQVFIEVQNG